MVRKVILRVVVNLLLGGAAIVGCGAAGLPVGLGFTWFNLAVAAVLGLPGLILLAISGFVL